MPSHPRSTVTSVIPLLPAANVPYSPVDADEGGNNLLLIIVLIVLAVAVVIAVSAFVRRERVKAVRRAAGVAPTPPRD